jgi:hypothetical protein
MGREAPPSNPARQAFGPWLTADALAVVALSAVAVSPLLPLSRIGLPLSGAFGIYAEDQLQYFAWIRDAAAHVVAGNRFDLAPGMRTFLQPAFALSALLHKTSGLSIPLSYLVWEPVAIVLVFLSVLAYVRRLVPSGWPQRAALILALFSISPAFVVLQRVHSVPRDMARGIEDLSQEVWLAGNLWGYPVTVIAISLMPVVLLALESWRTSGARVSFHVAMLGSFLVSWLHPWQGATLALAVGFAEAVEYWRTRRLARPGLLLIFGALAIPGLYYQILTRLDPAWLIYQQQNTFAQRPWMPPVFALGPLAAPAILAYTRPAPGWQELVVRAWPLVAVSMYVVPAGAFPYHWFDGLTIPLAILAVNGVASVWPRIHPSLVVVVALVMVLPGWRDSLGTLAAKAMSGEHGYFITPDEEAALATLADDPRPGGVLTTVSTGALVPYKTGREVYVGHDSWSPQFHERSRQAETLFDGRLSAGEAQSFVRSTHARFLLADCRHQTDLRGILRPLLSGVMHFGCATVYELIERPDMTAAAGAPDA